MGENTNNYLFFYSYQDELYGVLEHNKEDSMLTVQMIRTGEAEEIDGDWLEEKILNEEVDISVDPESVEFYKKDFLSKHLPTSS